MTITLYRNLGNTIANDWGMTNVENTSELIQNFTHAERANCLLAAAVSELKALNQELLEANRKETRVYRNLIEAAAKKPVVRDVVADGMLRWLSGGGGLQLISSMDSSWLSLRSRNVLRSSGFTKRSEITAERLKGIKNCGTTTINELLEWAKLA